MALRGVVWLGCAAALLAGGVAADPPSASPVALALSQLGPGQRPVRIMPLGASSTVGTRSPETGGYRGYLERLLSLDRVTFDFVGSQKQGPSWMPDRDHEGHAGATIPALMASVPGWIRATHPDVVLLHVGTNDLLRGASGTETAARLEKLLTAIWAADPAGPDPYVVVAGVWAPMASCRPAKADFTVRAAALVSRLRGQGRPVVFVDTSALLPPADVADGLHANAKGYELVAKVWEREIKKYLTVRH